MKPSRVRGVIFATCLLTLNSVAQTNDPLPVLRVTFTVTDFKPVPDARAESQRPQNQRRLTGHAMEMADLAPKYLLKTGDEQWRRERDDQNKRTIRVSQPGAILQFTVKGPGDTYEPIGITFERSDSEDFKEVPVDKPESPFSELKVDATALQFKNVPLYGQEGMSGGKKQATRPTHITYKFSLHIKRASDGAVGIIDPYVENENQDPP